MAPDCAVTVARAQFTVLVTPSHHDEGLVVKTQIAPLSGSLAELFI